MVVPATPYAEFVPRQVTGLAALPHSGQVTWDVARQVQGNEATFQARMNFQFGYFNLAQPRVPIVLSVEDNIRLELDLRRQRVSG